MVLIVQVVVVIIIKGKVINEVGKVVVGVEVCIEGFKQVIFIDVQGNYEFIGVQVFYVYLYVYLLDYVYGDNDFGDISSDQVVDFVLMFVFIENIVVIVSVLGFFVFELVMLVLVIDEYKL